MKLDLGCGSSKHEGFYGIDKKQLEGVDLVWDLNKGIPLPDNSAEWVMVCRFAHVDDWQSFMAEIHRVLIHRGIVCILAPYAHSFRHISNPLLKHRFDERSPRYWTGDFFQPPHCPVSPADADYGESLDVPFDFRLLRMELFYAESFRPPFYDHEELEMLLSLQVNLVDEIMYHLVAVKEPVTTEELEKLARQSFPEPVCASRLRLEKESWPDGVEADLSQTFGDPEQAIAPTAGTSSTPTRFRKKKPLLHRSRNKRSRIHH